MLFIFLRMLPPLIIIAATILGTFLIIAPHRTIKFWQKFKRVIISVIHGENI